MPKILASTTSIGKQTYSAATFRPYTLKCGSNTLIAVGLISISFSSWAGGGNEAENAVAETDNAAVKYLKAVSS